MFNGLNDIKFQRKYHEKRKKYTLKKTRTTKNMLI